MVSQLRRRVGHFNASVHPLRADLTLMDSAVWVGDDAVMVRTKCGERAGEGGLRSARRLLAMSLVVVASACGDGLLTPPQRQCDGLQVDGDLSLQPYPSSSDPEPVEGPATVVGAGPYALRFDSGEVFELGAFAAPVPDAARVYARIEQRWSGPQTSDPRVVLWTLVNDTERGVFARAWWRGPQYMSGDFGDVRYFTRANGQSRIDPEPCDVNVRSLDLVVERGSMECSISPGCQASCSDLIVGHSNSFEWAEIPQQCPDIQAQSSAGYIVDFAQLVPVRGP